MRIIIADKRQNVRSALRLLIEQETDFVVKWETNKADELLSALRQHCVELVLLDWELPGLNAVTIIQDIRKTCPEAKIISLSGSPEAMSDALNAGADAFISKNEAPHYVLSIIRLVSEQQKRPS